MSKNSSVFYRKQKRPKPTISHGEGIHLWDTEGKRYIDASGGAIVVNVGHGVQEIVDAMSQQAARVAYAHATMFTSDPLEELSARLANKSPMDDARSFILTSGSEANEAAMKFARQVQMARGYQNRHKVITRWGSYHGATLGTLGISGKPSMREPYRAMFIDMPHVRAPFPYHCSFGSDCNDCGIAAADALMRTIEEEDAETIAAFIAEPISGATLGAVVPPDSYWPRIREICDEHGILMIIDEVMTGMGRTGRWFGIEHWEVSPDVMCLGKGLSGGYAPLSAMAARGELVELVWNEFGDFNHGGTYSHQPVGAAAGVATMDYLETHQLVELAATNGEYLGSRLRARFEDHPQVGEVRGRGMMWAIEIVLDRELRTPYPAADNIAGRIYDACFAHGLIVYAVQGCVDGTIGDHIMVAPPLICTAADADEITMLLEQGLAAVLG